MADDRDTETGPARSGSDKPIGRRAFLGLLLAGAAALFLGRGLFGRDDTGPGTTSSTVAGGSGPGGSTGSTTFVGELGTADDFRINSVAPAPEFDPAAWTLTLEGLFHFPAVLTWEEFRELPQVERVRSFYCVEGWSVSNVPWRGVQMSEILQLGGIESRATHLVFHSGDGVYDDSITIEEARLDDTLLAFAIGDEPLPQDMGRPLRLVLPDTYGYKYVKWVERIEAIEAESYSGYWEDRGYPESGRIG